MINTPDHTGFEWVKSTYSGGEGGQCVEWSPAHATDTGIVPIRDSKTPDGPILTLSPTAFTGLVEFARRTQV
ncbi:DUF397 domain-containing protein [Streptomyces sp. NPDC020965]|uniref:DUF397 domain-containing protein n=1 Tax=Streptomyces sp. NPDC020965 TaxID=3365105 RepID=UPI00378E5BE8